VWGGEIMPERQMTLKRNDAVLPSRYSQLYTWSYNDASRLLHLVGIVAIVRGSKTQ